MILKAFQINSKKIFNNIILLHGANEGYKNDIINIIIKKDF